MAKLVFPLSDKEAKMNKVKNISSLNKDALFPTRLRELRTNNYDLNGKIEKYKITLSDGTKSNPITQQMLADKINVTKSTISLYEMGDNVPDAKTIVKLAKYFNVSTDYLLCQTDDKTKDIDIKLVCNKTGLSEDAINKILHWKMIYGDFPDWVSEEDKDKYIDVLSKRVLNTFMENSDLYNLLSKIASLYVQYKIYKDDSSVEVETDNYSDKNYRFQLWEIQRDIEKTILSTLESLYEKGKKVSEDNA